MTFFTLVNTPIPQESDLAKVRVLLTDAGENQRKLMLEELTEIKHSDFCDCSLHCIDAAE